MNVYISPEQLEQSLLHLADLNPFFGMSFLAFKRERLPVGEMTRVVFTQVIQDFLDEFYRVVPAYKGFYNPFYTSDRSNRWTAARYGSTSLQRITTDTFADAMLHVKKEPLWGWRHDYLLQLKKHLAGNRIPAFHLGAWLYRAHQWPSGSTPIDVIIKLRADFALSDEYDSLFYDAQPENEEGWSRNVPMTEGDILAILGDPPGLSPPSGAALISLAIREVGPAKDLLYSPAERLNIITGNNSLGKTFLLETMWWALTGNWLEYPADPHRNVGRRQPHIAFTLASPARKEKEYSATYVWDKQQWATTPSTPRAPGLVVYARFDGSFAIWDPARALLEKSKGFVEHPGRVFLSRTQVWEGSQGKSDSTSSRRTSNGLLSDWVLWQTGGERYVGHYAAFVSSLTELSPSQEEPLRPGEPTRFPLDARLIPTLEMPYGTVPILHSSAAVQRVVALAYVLVWAWQEHIVSCELIRQEPQKSIVLIVDEIEAHLHPLWQRLIAPALMRVASRLDSRIVPQIHVATHSPLVLASVETFFDNDLDALHHLKAMGPTVVLDCIPFVKRGRADLWLLSEAFGLAQARSIQAEDAISQAKALQLGVAPKSTDVQAVDRLLTTVLAPDDDFWPRWRFFAEGHKA